MCFGPFAPKAPKMMALSDLSAANRKATDEASVLQEGREQKKPDDIARVNIGSTKKQTTAAQARGSSALTIDRHINTGELAQGPGGNTGGLNV